MFIESSVPLTVVSEITYTNSIFDLDTLISFNRSFFNQNNNQVRSVNIRIYRIHLNADIWYYEHEKDRDKDYAILRDYAKPISIRKLKLGA